MMRSAPDAPPRRPLPRVPWLALLTLLALPGTWLAPLDAGAAPQVQPFIYVETAPTSLDLGELYFSQTAYDSPATLTVRLYANLSHGGVMVSLSPLERVGGGAQIAPERVLVKRSDMTSYVPLSSPINLTGPRPPGYFEYVLQFRVETPAMDPAGQYTGTLTLTYGVAP